MSWLNLNESFNSLKGQITNFASEVLSDVPAEDTVDSPQNKSPETTALSDLEEKCRNQDLEIASLKKLNEELQASLQAERISKRNADNDEASSWYWDPPSQSQPSEPNENVNLYKVQIRALQDELSTLKERKTIDIGPDAEEEINKLKEENKNLTANLEDLDNQHQLAMDRLLVLKKELQKNFEVLKQEHDELKSNNDECADENKMLLAKIGERDKEIETAKADYSTLQHKYQNLERVYGLLRENAEKFQEENQELHEEVFKLQEQVTKLEHDLEMAAKNAELADIVTKDKYNELLKELNDLKERKSANPIHSDEINIDDNAKSVIENLKRDINELRHKLSEKDHSDIFDSKIKDEKIMQLYNKYINFEIPLDFVGDTPSVGEDLVLYKLESVFKTVNSFKKEINNLEHKLSEKNLNLNHMQTQIDDLTSENDFLTSDIQQIETELSDMKKNNDFLLSEITALKNMSKLEPIIETHEDNITKLESDLADSTNLNKKFESEIKRIQDELAEVNREKSFLRESLDDMKTKYITMLSQLEICQTKTAEVAELEATCERHADAHNNSTDDVANLKNKLNEVNAKKEQLSTSIQSLEHEKALLTKQIDDLKHSLEEKSSAHKELESLKTALDNKLQDFETKLDEVIKNKAEVESEKAKLEEKVNNLENQILGVESLNKNLEKVTTERGKLNERNTAFIKENATLKETVRNLTAQIKHLQLREQKLLKQASGVKQITIITKNPDDEVKNMQPEELHAEVKKIKFENTKLKNELKSTETRIVNLEQDFEKILGDLEEKESTIEEMNITKKEDSLTIFRLNRTVEDLQQSEVAKNEELERMRLRAESLSNQLVNVRERLNQSQEELYIVRNNTEDIGGELSRLREEMTVKNGEIESLTTQLNETEKSRDEYKTSVMDRDKEIHDLTQKIIELSGKTNVTYSEQHCTKDDYNKAIQEKDAIQKEVMELKANVTAKETEIEELKSKLTEVQGAVDELNTVINKATTEKSELINLINMKHNESIQYHNEIQRLNQVILDQTNEFKTIIDEKDKLIHNNLDHCVNCDNLKVSIKEKDDIIISLNHSISDYDQIKSELANATEMVKVLTEKCNTLDRNLGVQLDTVKKLTAENAQLSEQEQNSSRELERLRRHLVETEESYTQELMSCEQKLTECQSRLHQVEERAKQTSTVYTSNSIRANQEVETLRNQIKLLEKQRDEVQARLGAADDARGRADAALTNLQIVLEQFQLEKEREVRTATEKIRNKMEEVRRENRGLLEEISQLKAKLEQSAGGLLAAARLADTLHANTALIALLRQQVKTLEQSVAAAEERYHNAVSNQQDKVDKNLVKNLVINYVITAANNTNKTQVLRVLSTVLDFNQQECERLGLVRAASSPDSLAAEFVRFLQSESLPRPAPPAPASRKNSTTAPPGAGDRRPSSARAPGPAAPPPAPPRRALDPGVSSVRDTAGATLAHVLRDATLGGPAD